MNIKVSDKEFGDIILDVNCEDARHLRILRRKDTKFTLEQNPGKEDALFIACYLEDGEWEKNYDQLDWECAWPQAVGFVTRDRHTRDCLGEAVTEQWKWKDFDNSDREDNNADELRYNLTECLYKLIRDVSCLYRTPDTFYRYMTYPDNVDQASFDLAVDKYNDYNIVLDTYNLFFRLVHKDKIVNDDNTIIYAQASEALKHIRSILGKYVVKLEPEEGSWTFIEKDEAVGHDDWLFAGQVSEHGLYSFCEIYAEWMLRSTDEKSKLYWHLLEQPSPGTPYAILPDYAIAELDLYRHSGDAWSYSGCGMQCQWDTSHAAGLLYYDPTALKKLLKAYPEEKVKSIVQQDFDLTLHLLSEDVPDVYCEMAYNTLGEAGDDDTMYIDRIYYDSFTDRDNQFENLVKANFDKWEQIEFTVIK